ncbi:anthranilate synthase component I family protein [Streptomyces sp. CC224B]|uniref:anthranilate synthase component I family protein n=1 Tax=Streptomyces sp. CC224B TaxID=3044571 RepID=UPI0024A85B82|nr:anthranilate synthase component I family protein [Streptomyces sp. CC224B]
MATIDVRVSDTGLPPHDPLDLYALLRGDHGRDTFLFESVDGADQDRRWAAVGFGRLAEIRVYADHVDLDGTPALARALAAVALTAGLRGDHPEAPDPGVHRLRLTGPGQVWDLLAGAQRLFAVETGRSPDTYAFGFLTSFAYGAAWHMEALPARTKPPRGPDITLTLFRHTVWYDLADGSVTHLRADSRAFADADGEPVGEGLAGGGSAGEGPVGGGSSGEGPAGEGPVGEGPGGAGLVALARAAAAAPPRRVPAAPAPASVRDSVSRRMFLDRAGRCLAHIRVGDIYQIQIGHRVDVRTELTPLDVYRRLRSRNPSPYMYLMPRAGRTLIGASPELFFRVEGGRIVMRPIAGTARRGPDEEENARRVKEMRESVKEQAEHVMLVDLCRNDIGRVTTPGTLPVDRLMAVERYSHVFHLVSTVSGDLEPGVDPWRAVRATFPAGTMTGAPKVRAMEIVEGLEEEPRGAYAGAVGLVDARGWSELALCIRTVEHDGDTYATQSSAGIVAQSDPEAEWRETLAKMGAAYWALTGEELLP